MKVVAVPYPGGSAANNPNVLGCAENALGLREDLEEGLLGGYAGDVCKAGVIGVFTPQAMTFPIGALQQRNLTVGSRSNRSPKRIEEE